MMKSHEKLSPTCAPPEDVVAYLYREMEAAKLEAFEQHLAFCDHCTAELADLSFARLDVYEWHRDEFLPMETPAISVPLGRPGGVSMLAGLREFFAPGRRLAFSGGLLGLVAVAVVGAYLALGPTPKDFALETAVTPTQQIESPELADSPAIVETNTAAKATQRASGPDPEVNEPPIVAAAAARERRQPGNRTAERKPKRSVDRPVQVRTARPPRLNDFEDDEDTTLRLGDLMAEIDAKD